MPSMFTERRNSSETTGASALAQHAEDENDQAFDQLRVYNHDRDAVILALLQSAQINSMYAVGPTVPLREMSVALKWALARLLPRVYVRCERNPGNVGSDFNEDVADALSFANRYDSVAHIFTLLHKGLWSVEVPRARHLLFTEVDPANGSDMLDNRIQEYLGVLEHEPKLQDRALVEAEIDTLRESFRTAHSLALGSSRLNTAEKQLLPYCLAASRRFNPNLRLLETLDLGGYALRDAFLVWMALKAIAFARNIRQSVTRQEFQRSYASADSIVQMPQQRMAALIADLVDLEIGKVDRVLAELTLDPDIPRPDLLVRPLLKVADGLAFAPFIIDTADAETCILRNLARDHGRYGKIVPPIKERLSDEIAARFREKGYRAASRRRIVIEGARRGDVDVAVLDSAGNLCLIEVKWLIPPDSTRESLGAENEIRDGKAQAEDMLRTFKSLEKSLIKQLHPLEVRPGEPRTVSGMIVAKGSVGDQALTAPCVYELDLLYKELDSHEGELPELWRKIEATYRSLLKPVSRTRSTSFSLAGWLLTSPVYNAGTFEMDGSKSRARLGRNDRCICGSGRKYKRCCQPFVGRRIYPDHA